MRRARAWTARALLAAARFLVGEERPEADDDDEELPRGPAVVLSPLAREMLRDGARKDDLVEAEKTPAPVAGSLRARVAARRNSCP